MHYLSDRESKALQYFAGASDLNGVVPLSAIIEEHVAVYKPLCRKGYINAADSHHPRLTDKARNALDELEYMAEKKAECDAKRREEDAANNAKAVEDKKQQFRHDFHVAAFSVALTLALERLGDIVHFVQVAAEKVLLFLRH